MYNGSVIVINNITLSSTVKPSLIMAITARRSPVQAFANTLHVVQTSRKKITKSSPDVRTHAIRWKGTNITADVEKTSFDTDFPHIAGFCRIVVGSVHKLGMLGHTFRRNNRGVCDIITGSRW